MSSKSKKKSTGSVKGMAVDTWEKLEQVFEARVARVLNAMQIPSHEDVQQLSSRVEALTKAVEKLAGKPVVTPAAKRKKKSSSTSARKSATKKKAGKRKPASAGGGRKQTRTGK